MNNLYCSILGSLVLVVFVSAHPHEGFSEKPRMEGGLLGINPLAIEKCRLRSRNSEMSATAATRRAETIAQLRQNMRGNQQSPDDIQQRDLGDILSRSHEFTTTAIQENGDSVLLFSDHSSYMLQSETTPGPYYVNGELIRSHIAEGQDGVPVFLDIQLIDTSNCRPIKEAYVDIWHCNATGVYSGVNSIDNGNFEDKSNINTNFLRGIQPTNSNGVIQFQTIFPGHYEGEFFYLPILPRNCPSLVTLLLRFFSSIFILLTLVLCCPNDNSNLLGRTTHIHLLVHDMATTAVRKNGTIESSANSQNPRTVYSSHTGQLFFDTMLIRQVETRTPYVANTQHLILNSEDAILMEAAHTSDPIMQYVFLGNSIEDGIFAWTTLGISPEAHFEVKSSASWYDGFGKQWRKLWR